jgi:hypothetical protein
LDLLFELAVIAKQARGIWAARIHRLLLVAAREG